MTADCLRVPTPIARLQMRERRGLPCRGALRQFADTRAFSALARPVLICPYHLTRRTEATAPRLRQWRYPGRRRLVFCREGGPFCRSRPALSRQAARRGQWSFGWRKAVEKRVPGVYAARLPCIFRIRRGLPEKAAALRRLAPLPQQAFQPLLEYESRPLHRFRRFQRRKTAPASASFSKPRQTRHRMDVPSIFKRT